MRIWQQQSRLDGHQWPEPACLQRAYCVSIACFQEANTAMINPIQDMVGSNDRLLFIINKIYSFLETNNNISCKQWSTGVVCTTRKTMCAAIHPNSSYCVSRWMKKKYIEITLLKYSIHINQKLCGKSVFEWVADKCTVKWLLVLN